MSKMLRARAAAAALGVSRRRVQYLCAGGRVPGARKVLGVWLVPPGLHVTPGTRGPKSRTK